MQGRLIECAHTHDWVGVGWPGEDRKCEHAIGVLSCGAVMCQLVFAVVSVGVVGVMVGCFGVVGGVGSLQVMDSVDSECACAEEHMLGCGAGSAQTSD